MYRFEKETEQILLGHEKKVFNKLKNSYAHALADTKRMTKKLTNEIEKLEKVNPDNETIIRSKIHRLNYQKALEEELKASISILNKDNVDDVYSFLENMYEDGFISINYHLQQHKIPVIMPINPSLMAKVINTPVEDMKFSERLYKNTSKLKDVVKSEITRGIATGKSYSEIAKRVSRVTEASFNQAYRIARTEGGRVSSQAKQTSMEQAKKQGADIVKQWDATLDGKTRFEHAMLDQQIREIDEPFEIEGMKAMEPHGFGLPHMDINCRCIALCVPRWDIEEMNERYDPEIFKATGNLITVSNYSEWKERYHKKISWYTEMKPELKSVLYDYISSTSYKINELLYHSHKLTKEQKKYVSDLDKALSEAPKYEGTIYRSVDVKDQEHLNEILSIFNNDDRIGNWGSYISASKKVYDSDMKLQFVIKSKTGRDISILNSEGGGEIVFERSTKFKVLSSNVENGKVFVYLEEVE